ncbi:MAG: carboxypeptidase-like regulatory domain-containing protein [Bryobacteraceae bacterium]
MLRFLAIQLISVGAALLAHQTSAVSTSDDKKCTLSGTAVDFLTGQPLRKATIRLTPEHGIAPGYLGTTDDQGHFHLEGIKPGTYDLSGERTGYLKSEFDARIPGGDGTILTLKADGSLADLTVTLV